MRKIADVLRGVAVLGMDTDVIIYFVDARAAYIARMADIFQRIANGTLSGVTSTITLTEGLIQPLRNGDVQGQQDYRDLLLHSDLQTRAIDPPVAERAADLRARYNLRTPDALQAAAALEGKCDAFLTNNGKHFRRVTELNVLVLDELEL